MSRQDQVTNNKLKENLNNQLSRLIQQLEDLDSYRDEMNADDYQSERNETIDQLNEFNESLDKLAKGDISLLSTVEEMKLATKEAISKAFKTPEVQKFFGHNPDINYLRKKLEDLENQLKLGQINNETAYHKKAEILTSLRETSEKLTSQELQFLEQYKITAATQLKNFKFKEVVEEQN